MLNNGMGGINLFWEYIKEGQVAFKLFIEYRYYLTFIVWYLLILEKH